MINAQPTVALPVGSTAGWSFTARGCSTPDPLAYSVVAGVIPTGMTVGTFQTSTLGNLLGTPSVPGTYRFTMQATDGAGATDQENFTIKVV